MIYWCNDCKIPFYSDDDNCSICNTRGFLLKGGTLVPVYLQEKKLLSYILNRDVTKENIWYKGNAIYIFNGVSKRIPYVEFYKRKEYLRVRNDLRKNIDYDDVVYNESDFLEANRSHFETLVYEAENYINKTIEKYKDYTPAVSFSGGKDSIVVSKLVRDALLKNDVMHFLADTTLELPDTYDYTKNFRKENVYTPLLVSKPDSNFFSLCEYLGPPSRLERWCCTIFKTSNFNTFVKSLPGEKDLLSFMGIRRSESVNRKKYKRTQKKSKISKQIVSMPIIDWADFDIWLYIKYKRLAFNNAYKLGYRRVGCWCCPSNSIWSELLTAVYYPELYDKWQQALYDFAKKTNKTDIVDYIENDKWKARKGASGLKSRNVDIEDTDCSLNKNTINIIVEKSMNERFIEFIKPFGIIKVQKKLNNVTLDVFENNEKIFTLFFIKDSNILKLVINKNTDRTLLLNRLKCQIRKYQFCIHCSACDAVCEQLAISTFNGEYRIDEEKCKHCKKCIANFYNGCLTTQVLANKKGGV